jgi:hypothetical protein
MVLISSVEGVLQELKEAEAAEEAARTVEAAKAAPGPRPQASPEPDPGQLKSQALEKRLDEPVKLAFSRETPLEDVLAYLKKETHASDAPELPIYIDPGVQEKLKSLVQLDLPGAPLRTSLTLLLGQVDLAWGVHDGLLIVSTPAHLNTIRHIASQLAGTDQDPVNQQILAKLAAPLTLTFPSETPLDEIINTIRRVATSDEAPIPIYLGPPVSLRTRTARGGQFIFDSKPVGSIPVQINIKDIPIRTCLAVILSQPQVLAPRGSGGVSTLDARVIGGVLIIGETNWFGSLSIPKGVFGRGVGSGMMGGAIGGAGFR